MDLEFSIGQSVDALSNDSVARITIEGDDLQSRHDLVSELNLYLEVQRGKVHLFVGHSVHGELFLVGRVGGRTDDAGLDTMFTFFKKKSLHKGLIAD